MKAIRFFAVLIILFISNNTISQENNSTTCFQVISGTVKDQITNKVVKNAAVRLYQKDNLIKTINTDNKGAFNIEVPCENSFFLVAHKSLYSETKKKFATSNVSNLKVEFTLYISPEQVNACTQIINGKITDEYSNKPISNVTVEVRDLNEKLISTDITNSNGNYHFNFSCKQRFTILFSKEGYITSTTQIETTKTDKKVERIDIVLHEKICNQTINGIIVNSKTNKPVESVSVIILKDNVEVIRFNNLTEGTFHYETVCSSQYKIKVSAANYGFVTKQFKTTDLNDESFDLIFSLDPVNNKSEIVEEKKVVEEIAIKEVSVEEEIIVEELEISNTDKKPSVPEDKNLKLNEVKFELNQSRISKKIANELDKIVQLMNNSLTVTIELNSHTDSRGPKSYNQILTDARAQSMVSYVLSKGIDATRVTGKGFGETKPLNECSKGKRCSEDEHQKNKRIEFIILNNESN